MLVTVTLIAPNTSHVFISFLDMPHLLTLLPTECPCEVMLCCSMMSVDIFVQEHQVNKVSLNNVFDSHFSSEI